MSKGATIISFKDVDYQHQENKPILIETSFSIRRGAKLTLMGKNGAGKSTLFGLITKKYFPDDGVINIQPNTSIAISRQVIPRDEMELTVREFFEKMFSEKIYNIDPRIDEVLEIVNLDLPEDQEEKNKFKDRLVGSFSGGQQARLLLASALIQKPEILLLDEPTNNLDIEGIKYLTNFLKDYKKTVIVISHDADFLNAFTEGVLYLNAQTRKIEKFDGNYNDVLKDIQAQVAKEMRKNTQAAKEIQANKDKANYFANKGGRLRAVAKKMREKVEDYEASKIDVRREDKTIRKFQIPAQEKIPLNVLKLTSCKVIENHKAKDVKCEITLQRGDKMQIVGPNGIGKTTLLESLAGGKADGEEIAEGVTVGYYRQDFSNLDFDKTPREILLDVMEEKIEQNMRAFAAGFLIDGEIIGTKLELLSEGQKALVAFARLSLLRPGLLILDEPTNHVNFRHIPVIAKALKEYEGAMILVSHVPDFVKKVGIEDNILDLGKFLKK
jgi:ATPase subunit of ABC transporter with duplicated ATPase domains